LDKFCERIEKQVRYQLIFWTFIWGSFFNSQFFFKMFTPSTPLESIASCVQFVRIESLKLRDELGLDVVHLIDSRFRGNVERTVSFKKNVWFEKSSDKLFCRSVNIETNTWMLLKWDHRWALFIPQSLFPANVLVLRFKRMISGTLWIATTRLDWKDF